MGIPDASFAYEHLSFYTSLPHLAGTPGDYETALYTHGQFQLYGMDSRIEEETVLLSYPISRRVAVVSPSNSTYECIMQEDVEPSDPTSGDPRVVPTFNGYAPTGNVTAEVIYVNYASKEDFEALKAEGIETNGKIAIARYGYIFRGTKAMIAQEYGVVGLLIYSDPADDGYAKGPVYPEGPMRSNSSVQRGSTQFLSICPGNPARPICTTKDKADSFSYTQVIPSIPVQPLSWSDAEPILRSLRGKEVPPSFRGALPIRYYFGPGPGVVNMDLKMKFVNTTIWNVIASIPADPSSPFANEQVLVGNHRDAWVFGAADPNSGTAVMLDVARSLSQLVLQGYQPQREIIFCSWDAEEYGLLGSTAFVERHNASLVKNAIAYLNVDTAVTGGAFSATASPSLASLIQTVSEEVPYPGGVGGSLRDNWNGEVAVLGSGSDYTAFLHHYGIPSVDLEFDGPYGVYHSVYDSMNWMKSFGDPTFQYYVTLSQTFGLIAMRLADREILQLNYGTTATSMQQYYTSLQQLATEAGMQLDFSALSTAINTFASSAQQVNKEVEQAYQTGNYSPDLNRRLQQTERQFIGLGLPLRPYYKHVLQAPGLYQGYAPETFPGITQAISNGNAQAAQSQVQITAFFITKAANFLLSGSSQVFSGSSFNN